MSGGVFESTKVIGICPACGQPSKLIKTFLKEEYFWNHDNPRDSYVHRMLAPDKDRKTQVEPAEAQRLIDLVNSGKRTLIDHSDCVVCVQTGEVYPHKWAAIRETGVHPSALGNALNNGCQAGGSFWRYEDYFWLPLEEPRVEEASPSLFDGPSFMAANKTVADPADALRGKACPQCGSQQVYVEGRTMLPALMEARDIIIAAELTSLTGVDKTTIGRLKKWDSHRSVKDMAAAQAIAVEFGVTVDDLLSLDIENYYLEYFWESPPSRVVCWDCHYELPWRRWLRKASSKE